MQIIINRIAIIDDNKRLVHRLKIGTAVFITLINIAVFCVWIPAHMMPPPSNFYVDMNRYWDRTSKILICIVDAGLNLYFLRTVRLRVVRYYGLTKYKPLVTFNAKLMVLSITIDVMVIGLMSLPNQLVYVQFQAVAYMAKLNIEMSMASLIARLAKGQSNNDVVFKNDYTHACTGNHDGRATMIIERSTQNGAIDTGLAKLDTKAFRVNTVENSDHVTICTPRVSTKRSTGDSNDIVCRTDLQIVVEDLEDMAAVHAR